MVSLGGLAWEPRLAGPQDAAVKRFLFSISEGFILRSYDDNINEPRARGCGSVLGAQYTEVWSVHHRRFESSCCCA